MTISNSINVTATAADIITEAYEILGEISLGTSPEQAEHKSALRTLNYLCKHLQTKNYNLFALKKLFVFLQTNQREYTLGPSSSDHFTYTYAQTNLAADASSGATSITVDSITDIADGDNIGVQVDDGTLHWTTVNGTPSGSTITLTTGLDDDASDGGVVYAYTTLADRPMKVVYQQASLRKYSQTGSFTDVTIDVIAREEYHYLSDKTSDGEPNQVYYDPQIGSGKLYVWPEASQVSDMLKLWVQRTLSDLDEVNDDIEFPQEWYLPLAYNLAKYMAPKVGVGGQQYNVISASAKETLDDALGWDTEAYTQIQPETRYWNVRNG